MRSQAAHEPGGDRGQKREKPAGWPRGLHSRLTKTFSGAVAAAAILPDAAMAQGVMEGVLRLPGGLRIGAYEMIQLATFSGVLGAAMVSALWLIRERGRTAAENTALRERIAELNGAVQRADAVLGMKDQRIVVWAHDTRRPEVIGAIVGNPGVPEDRAGFLAFGRWLTPRSAARLDNAIARLRDDAVSFELTIETPAGAIIEVQGMRSASHAVVRFMALTERQRELAVLRLRQAELQGEFDTLVSLLDAAPFPFWQRNALGRLVRVNTAYAAAVEAESATAAVGEGREILPTQAREAMTRHHAGAALYKDTLSTVIAGDRRFFSVVNYRGEIGSAGIAIDRSEIEAAKAENEVVLRSYAETLDQLTTAVAVFDGAQRLVSCNQAFRKLWELDPVFLSSQPDNALFLDRLRSEGKLPEQPEWRRWKEAILAAYRAVETQEHWWHLPDGRTVRVLANPQPKGGVIWIFENLTERFDLESRYNTAVKVQGETLDNLAEGVAVFGPDGRLRLFNPSFLRLWKLSGDAIRQGSHIGEIRALAEAGCAESPWPLFVSSATGFADERREAQGRVELVDGSILSYGMIPLPNGQMMVTFVDVTDSVNFENALKEKNEALERADQIKNDFVQHVSYELRSPLTNIIGFTELLAQPETGPLNPRQRDYVDHIGSSSSVLLTIVNDILDLATVDAGIMELDMTEVPVDATMRAAAALVADRLREHDIRLAVDTGNAPPTLMADENRLRQVLFNLLANAANYAPEGSLVTLRSRASAESVEFEVHDDGPGMPQEVLDTVFRRFEPRVNGGRRRGAGLGLSVVKSFVELHGGTVTIRTGDTGGTTVTCRFPLAPEGARRAAE